MHSPLRNLQAHAFVGSFETALPNTRHIPNCLGYGFGKANSRQPKGKKVQNGYYYIQWDAIRAHHVHPGRTTVILTLSNQVEIWCVASNA